MTTVEEIRAAFATMRDEVTALRGQLTAQADVMANQNARIATMMSDMATLHTRAEAAERDIQWQAEVDALAETYETLQMELKELSGITMIRS